jgi:glycosyltransferase involved in cell wall biosynthesis
VPPQEPAALAAAIRALLADEPRRQAQGRAARARVEAEFTQELMIRRVEEIYVGARQRLAQ